MRFVLLQRNLSVDAMSIDEDASLLINVASTDQHFGFTGIQHGELLRSTLLFDRADRPDDWLRMFNATVFHRDEQ